MVSASLPMADSPKFQTQDIYYIDIYPLMYLLLATRNFGQDNNSQGNRVEKL
jgi:hypothetical protein